MCLVGQLSVLVGKWPMADRFIVPCNGGLIQVIAIDVPVI